ncbi:MAG: citrate lyase subunit beta/citryl-CoA lyase [Acidimicrobiales bacterium]|jgi:citrate lyase subunit beta/citryl-CoA lyase
MTSQALTPGALPRLRSVLFAPAVRDDLIPKLTRSGADGVVIDCEDATPVSQKAAGRSNAVELAPTIMGQGSAVFIRVNPPGTPWFADDISFGLHRDLAGVVVPMVETLEGLDQCARALAEADLGHLGIVAGLETARGVADARYLLAHSQVIGGYFGAEDYIADLGGVRTQNNVEVQFARASIAQAGRLSDKPVIDQIVANFRDNDRMSLEAFEARAMGFEGKLCIHPDQVALANAGFTPSDAEIERAERLLAAYDIGVASGVAAIDFEGSMVDEPLAEQARQILAAAGINPRNG